MAKLTAHDYDNLKITNYTPLKTSHGNLEVLFERLIIRIVVCLGNGCACHVPVIRMRLLRLGSAGKDSV